VTALLALACLSPAAGAVVLSQVRLPGQAPPVLTSLVAGVLLRAAAGTWQLGRSGSSAGITRRRHSGQGAGSVHATVPWHPEPARLGQPTRAD
jgi:hypothetical protein